MKQIRRMEARNLHSVATSTFERNEIEEDALRRTCNDRLSDDKCIQSVVEITEEKKLLAGFILR